VCDNNGSQWRAAGNRGLAAGNGNQRQLNNDTNGNQPSPIQRNIFCENDIG